jgi:hypothetical protein
VRSSGQHPYSPRCSIRKGNSGRIAEDIELPAVALTETEQRQAKPILADEPELFDVLELGPGMLLLEEEEAPVSTDPICKVFGEVAEDVPAAKLGNPAP